MKNWTIARRISLGFTIVILIAIGLGLFAHNRLRVIRQGAGAIAGHSVPGLLVINDIQSLARRNYSETLKYVAEEDHQARARIFAVIQTNIN
ncbi:MAG TPA: MCP four helix bundle domain-containing protein, partial [Verrucomicrobiae bacterium]|nr:MCP four helix bundle domain-containing protein [Verrucomicrobiae bacterium]